MNLNNKKHDGFFGISYLVARISEMIGIVIRGITF
jgi:hypothetical protein